MPRKVLLGHLGAALLLAGCATTHEKAAPPPAVATPAAPVATPETSPSPAPPRTKARTTARPETTEQKPPAPPTRAELPGLIGSDASWVGYGFRSLVVNRSNPAARQPVPIFRQAGVLAAVRAALADSPAKPAAEFRRGLLTLTFERGSNAEIASAVRRALQTPEVGVMGVNLAP